MPGAPWPCPAHVLQGPPGSVGLESTRGLAGGAMRASLTCWCSTSLFGLRVEWLTVKVKMSQSHMSMCVSASRVALTNSTPPAAQRTHTYSRSGCRTPRIRVWAGLVPPGLLPGHMDTAVPVSSRRRSSASICSWSPLLTGSPVRLEQGPSDLILT